jgi:hypothetical protein
VLDSSGVLDLRARGIRRNAGFAVALDSSGAVGAGCFDRVYWRGRSLVGLHSLRELVPPYVPSVPLCDWPLRADSQK